MAPNPIVPRELDQTAVAAEPATDVAGRPQRITELDAVRGFALAGIIFANAVALFDLEPLVADGTLSPGYEFIDAWVKGHFFPIFSLLFGIGFGIMWRSAERHSSRPRLVMFRRLAALTVLGALHSLLQPGEALLFYGIIGLAVLLPITFVRPPARPWVLGLLSLIAVPAGIWFGGILLIPGLFITGYWLGASGLVPLFSARNERPEKFLTEDRRHRRRTCAEETTA